MTGKTPHTCMFDLMDTLVWSPNLMDLFAKENAELLARFKQDRKKYQRETAQVADLYLADGRVEIRLYDEVMANLSKLKERHRVNIAVLSNGANATIEKILEQTGLKTVVDLALSLEQFPGLDKSDPGLYIAARERLTEQGLIVNTYTDDKADYCAASAQSKAIPRTYHIDRKGKTPQTDNGIKVIGSLDEFEHEEAMRFLSDIIG